MAVGPRTKKIASGDFTATWELTMARKDTRLMIDEAQSHGVKLAIVPAIAAAFDDAIGRGWGCARFDRRCEAGRSRVIRYISEADVASCLTVPVTIGLLETAARDLAAGNASVAPRQRISSGPMRMNLLAGGCGGRIGHKCYPIMRPRGANFWVSLFGSDASLLAMIQANTLGQIRTGAASGLATKYMSRDDSTIVATIFGTGWQARTQLEAVCAVRPIERVYVIGRDPRARGKTFAPR